MLCMFCKQNPAKVHLTQIVGDKMQKVDLCEDCAKQKGVKSDITFSLTEQFLSASQEIAQAAGGVDLRCPGSRTMSAWGPRRSCSAARSSLGLRITSF